MEQFTSFNEFIKKRHEIKGAYLLLTRKDKRHYKVELYQKDIEVDLLDLIWEYFYNDISNNELKRNYEYGK